MDRDEKGIKIDPTKWYLVDREFGVVTAGPFERGMDGLEFQSRNPEYANDRIWWGMDIKRD